MGRLGIAHGLRDRAALHDHLGLYAEKCRLPEHEVREFSRFDRPDILTIPCEMAGLMVYFATYRLARKLSFRDDPQEMARVVFSFCRRLPGANDYFADAAHRLSIAGEHAE